MEKETSGVRINAPDGQAVRLRFSRIFSIGVRTIVSKPLRLITTLLMAVIVCSLSGFSVIAGMADEISCELRTMSERGYDIVSLSGSGADEAINDIDKFTHGNYCRFARIDNRIFFDEYIAINSTELSAHLNPYEDFSVLSIADYIEANPESGEGILGLLPDSRFADPSLCRLPETFDEIAITDIKADM